MKNYFLFLCASVLFSAPSVLLVLFYAHFGSVEDAARLGFAYSILAPVQLLLSMQHSIAILSGGKDWRECIEQRTVLGVLFLAAASLLAMVFGDWSLFALAFVRVGDFLYEPRFYGHAKAARLRALSAENAARFLVFVLAVLMVHVLDIGSITFELVAIGALNTGVAVLTVARAMNWVPISRGRSWCSGMFLGAAAFAASVAVNVPRYFLVSGDPSELAFYSNMLTLVLGGSLVYIALSNTLLVRYAASGREGLFQYLKAAVLVTAVAIILSFALFSTELGLSSVVVAVFLGEKYIPFVGLVAYFAVYYSLLFLQHSLNSVLISLKKNTHVLIGNVFLLVLLAVAVRLFAVPTAISVILVADIATTIFVLFTSVYVYVALAKRAGS